MLEDGETDGDHDDDSPVTDRDREGEEGLGQGEVEGPGGETGGESDEGQEAEVEAEEAEVEEAEEAEAEEAEAGEAEAEEAGSDNNAAVPEDSTSDHNGHSDTDFSGTEGQELGDAEGEGSSLIGAATGSEASDAAADIMPVHLREEGLRAVCITLHFSPSSLQTLLWAISQALFLQVPDLGLLLRPWPLPGWKRALGHMEPAIIPRLKLMGFLAPTATQLAMIPYMLAGLSPSNCWKNPWSFDGMASCMSRMVEC